MSKKAQFSSAATLCMPRRKFGFVFEDILFHPVLILIED